MAWKFPVFLSAQKKTHINKLNGNRHAVKFSTRDLSNPYLYGNATVDDGEWHHIAAVYDKFAGTKTLYIDGVIDFIPGEGDDKLENLRHAIISSLTNIEKSNRGMQSLGIVLCRRAVCATVRYHADAESTGMIVVEF